MKISMKKAAGICAAVITATALASPAQATSGPFALVAKHSGKCLDVTGGSMAAGASVKQYQCNGGSNQKWLYIDSGIGDFSQIMNLKSGMCLTAGNIVQGTGMTQQPCTIAHNRQLTISARGRGYTNSIKFGNVKCLDVAKRSTANGARVTLWDCNRQSNQQWTNR